MKLVNNYWLRWFIGGYLIGELTLVLLIAVWALRSFPGGTPSDKWMMIVKFMESMSINDSSTGRNFAVGWPVFVMITALFGVGAGVVSLLIAALKHWFSRRSSPNHRPHKPDNL